MFAVDIIAIAYHKIKTPVSKEASLRHKFRRTTGNNPRRCDGTPLVREGGRGDPSAQVYNFSNLFGVGHIR